MFHQHALGVLGGENSQAWLFRANLLEAQQQHAVDETLLFVRAGSAFVHDCCMDRAISLLNIF